MEKEVNYESDSSEFEEDAEQNSAEGGAAVADEGALTGGATEAAAEDAVEGVEGEEQNGAGSVPADVEETEAYNGLNFPIARIKKIMKADPDVNIISSDALFYVTKATEQFVGLLAGAAYQHTAQSARKTVQGRDVQACIERTDCLAFLDGALDD